MITKPILEIQNISKKYNIGAKQERYLSLRDKVISFLKPSTQKDTFWALKDISFKVERGECIGIIGRNGAGKSTLLKILSKITPPTKGYIKARGRIASLLEVGTGFHPELSGRENIYLNGSILGLRRTEINKKFDEIVDFSGVEQFLDTSLKHYSSGMQLRLAFAVAAHLEPEILLIDEVLAVGDSEFQKKCLGKMDEVTKSGRTVLFVSHNMGILKKICQRGILLQDGKKNLDSSIDDVIQTYLSSQKSSEKHYADNSIIRYVKAEQSGNRIVITAHYKSEKKLMFPSLGFVLSDIQGIPITGYNPTLDYQYSVNKYASKGVIQVEMLEPRLLDGTYRISLWFGDGTEDFFHDKDCIEVDIKHMTDLRQLSKSLVGSVSPKCIYHVNDE